MSEGNVQLKNIEGNNIYPKTQISGVDGLSDKLTALENKEDKDTVYDDSELRGRIESLEKNGGNSGNTSGGTSYDDSELRRRIEALEQNGTGGNPYDDTELRERIETLEDKECTPYDDSELKQRLTNLENKEEYDDSVLLDHISQLEAKVIELENKIDTNVKRLDSIPHIELVETVDEVGNEENTVYFVKQNAITIEDDE